MKKVLLGDIIELVYGKSLPQRSRVSGRFPVFGSNGQVDMHNKYLVGGPGIIVGRKGSVGEVIWSKQDFWPIDTTYYVKLKNPDDDLRYWYYVLKTLGLNKLNSHSAIPGLNRDVAYIKQVPLRSTLEQEKIANILGSLDEKIELNRHMNETLEQLGQALFRHYFIDNPDANSWKNIHLGDIVAITTGKGSTKANLSEYGKYPLYGANGIMGRSQSYLLNEKVIVTGRVGTLGVVRAVVDKAWFSDNVIIMKPDPSIFGYVFYVVCGIDYVSLNRGSTQPLITQTDLKNQRVKLPPLSTLQRFENSYAVIFNQIQANKRQMSMLVAIRDSLLPKLISGEIEV
jgi:restriction modification system DNA specificity subunit